jgi:hypothetical protein
VIRQPWAGYSLVFLPLFALELRRSPEGPRRPRLGIGVLALALTLELLLVAGGLTRAARPAGALAALGLAWLVGRPALRAVALLLWCVPVPSELVSQTSPTLETIWGEAAARLAQLVGSAAWFEVRHDEPTIHGAHATLRLLPSDGGLPVAALVAGVAWWAGLRRGASVVGSLGACVACATLAVPVEIVAIAAVVTTAGDAAAARTALDVAPWLAVAIVGLLVAGRVGRPPSGVARRPAERDGEPLSSPRR